MGVYDYCPLIGPTFISSLKTLNSLCGCLADHTIIYKFAYLSLLCHHEAFEGLGLTYPYISLLQKMFVDFNLNIGLLGRGGPLVCVTVDDRPGSGWIQIGKFIVVYFISFCIYVNT